MSETIKAISFCSQFTGIFLILLWGMYGYDFFLFPLGLILFIHPVIVVIIMMEVDKLKKKNVELRRNN